MFSHSVEDRKNKNSMTDQTMANMMLLLLLLLLLFVIIALAVTVLTFAEHTLCQAL